MSRHVSAETLSLYCDDAVSARKVAKIRSHLAGCARCEGAFAGLSAVQEILGAVQVPAMPEHLAQRIQLALANESAARVAASQAAADGVAPAGAGAAEPVSIPGRPDLPERSQRRRSRTGRLSGLSSPLVLRTLAATAAVAVVAGGGYLISSVVSGGQGIANGPATAGSAPRPGSGGTVRVPNGTLAAPTPVQYHRDGKIATTTALATNVNYSKRGLGPLVRRQVTRFGAALASPVVPEPSAAPSPSASHTAQPSEAPLFYPLAGITQAHLQGCLTRISSGRKVLLADVARYLGQPAVIIVLRPAKAADYLDVAVVALACSASDAHVITHLRVPAH